MGGTWCGWAWLVVRWAGSDPGGCDSVKHNGGELLLIWIRAQKKLWSDR